MDRIEPVAQPRWQANPYELRNPYGRRYPQRQPGQDSRAKGGYSYENEDQTANGGVRTGMRVRHKQFGVGTVVAVEDQGDDFKVTVKFSTAGTKKLMARFAGLERA
jgi:DNA helicase-2/ATP-dependent DNA helicase PcrA